jgi:hypothetical protein
MCEITNISLNSASESLYFQLKIIDQNAKKIAEIREEMTGKKEEGAYQLKNLAVLLSRTDESRRIQDYYDSVNN